MIDKRAEISIIGGGIVGLTTAWSLQKEGFSHVTILEKSAETTMEASGLNAGLIRHYHESLRIRRGLRRGISLLNSYQKRHSTSFFKQRPSLWIISKDQYLELEENHEDQLDWKRIPDRDEHSQFDTEKNGDKRYWISFTNDALLNSVKLGDLLRQEVKHSSVNVRTNAELRSGASTTEGWTLSLKEGEEWFADVIINAAGAWANEVAERLGLEKCNMTPVPKQLFQVEKDLVPKTLSYVMDQDERIMLRQSTNGVLISCSGEYDEIGTPETTKSKSCPDDHLNRLIGSRFPRLDLSPIKTSWSGWIARTPDRKPIIEPDPDDRSVIHATGLNDYGLSYGFHAGEKVLEFL